MATVDVLLNTSDLVVFGPPSQIEVAVDIGPQGTRGSKIFVGNGEPNTLTSSGQIFGEVIKYNDLYINSSSGTNYSYMYQYVSEPGGDTWVEIIRINPAIYSAIDTTTFTSGNASITIPISNIANVSGSPLTAANFNIQHTVVGTKPIASSIEIPELIPPGSNLVINFHCVEYNGSSWVPLSGSKSIHLFVSIV